jgi:hypothetical protein
MCFGGGAKQQAPQAAPVIQAIPTPAPQPTATAPVETESSIAERKRKQIASYQGGLASTIKTSAQGVPGSVNLLAPVATEAKKKKLGE